MAKKSVKSTVKKVVKKAVRRPRKAVEASPEPIVDVPTAEEVEASRRAAQRAARVITGSRSRRLGGKLVG